MNSSQINTSQSQSYYSSTKELKIKQLYSKIIQSIKDNLITFISSKTGSGKSTQVPKYLYQHLLKERRNLFVLFALSQDQLHVKVLEAMY